MQYAYIFKRLRFFVSFLTVFNLAVFAFFVNAGAHAFLDENLKLLLSILSVSLILLIVFDIAFMIAFTVFFAVTRRVAILRFLLPSLLILLLGVAMLLLSRLVLYVAK